MTEIRDPLAAAPPLDTRSTARRSPEQLLRSVLAANAALSAAAGVAGLLAADRLTEAMGLGDPTVMRVVSAALLVFAAAVGQTAVRAGDRLATDALLISMGDIAWVVATIVVVAVTDLTTFGRVVAVISGVGVADFAIAQLWLRSRIHA